MRDQDKRAVLIETMVASGLIAIGLTTGQAPLLALAATATSVGCNWTYSLAERGFRHWCNRWFTDDGVLNKDITKTLCHSFEEATRQVEHDWKHHRHYQYLQRKSPEKAQLTLDTLHMLREDGVNLFQQPDHFTQVVLQEQHVRIWSLLYQDTLQAKEYAREYLKPALGDYLYGHDDEFVTFVTKQLGSKWLLRFLEILKDPSEEGTRAWRAYQLLWQQSLMFGIDQIQRTTAETADTVRWLQEWAQQLRNQPPTERNPIGQDAMEEILHSVHAQLDEIQAAAKRIETKLEQVYQRLVPAEAGRPSTYIPFPRDPLFKPRPGEFERLETLLFGTSTQHMPARVGLVGVIGMGGVGKTQLAVELAYRCLDQQRFPGGIFWMPATGAGLLEWQRQLANLAFNTNYLLPGDDVSHPENEARRARYLCRYLASRADALLILDNVEDSALVTSVLPALAGGDVACTILYTSRNIQAPLGVTTHIVEQLPEEVALSLLLETTRPTLLAATLGGSQDAEVNAARSVCQFVGYLPLALVHLRGLLARDSEVSLVRLAEVLRQRGALQITRTLFATFSLSWEKVTSEEARRLFQLAAYFPEATPIPLWLLGLATGLGERGDILEPLGEARVQLQEVSLLEVLSGEQVRLHPLVRAFGRRLVAEAGGRGAALLAEAGKRLASTWTDLNWLEQHAQREGYWECLEHIRAVRDYVQLLGEASQAGQIEQIERWLDRESYLLADQGLWPTTLPGLFYQQLYNRAVEAGQPVPPAEAPIRWLRQTRPSGGEDQALLRLFAGHTGSVSSVAFSPDGKYVLTASDDKTVRLWEVNSGHELMQLVGHTGSVSSVAFSPDGKYVLTGSADHTARLWEVNSGYELTRMQGHTDSVRSVAFSPDGKYALTGSADHTARLWEVSDAPTRAWSVSISSQTAQVDVASELMRIADQFVGRELMRLVGHTGSVSSVAFSPDGKYVLTGSDDHTARLWEVSSGHELMQLVGHTGSVNSVAFSPDGKLIFTSSNRHGEYRHQGEYVVRLWEVSSGHELMQLRGHTDWVHSVASSPDGKYALTGSADHTARLWEVSSGHELLQMTGHTRGVISIAFSPDGKYVITGSADHTARLWEVSSGHKLTRPMGYTHRVESVAFSPDGKHVITGSADDTARLWEVSSGRELIQLVGHTSTVSSVTFSPDGKHVLTGSHDNTARLWEVNSGRELILMGHTGPVCSVAFSPDGKYVLTGCGGLLENSAGSQTVVRLMQSEQGMIMSWWPGIESYESYTLRLWEASNGHELMESHKSTVSSVAFSPDGKYMLTGSADHIARLWEVSSGHELMQLRGHTDWVSSVAFSPDGKYALTGSHDKTVRLWEVNSGRELMRMQGHTDPITVVAFSPDGRLAITCEQRGRVYFWHLQAQELAGLYVTTYGVGALHWQNTNHVVLADTGGSQGYPYFYYLILEGM